jgi:nucleoside-diphosphate-sugar epimerase
MVDSALPWEKLKDKTVFISEASEYVPAYFVYLFLARNDLYNNNIKVIALCKNEEKAKEKFGEFLKREDLKLLFQDVCEPIKINEAVHFFINGCHNILELARQNENSKVLLLSSADTKAAEELCKAYFLQHNVFATIARPYQIIGGGISLQDGRLHADFMNQLKTSGKITLKTDGKAERTFLYISDAVLGMLFVLLEGKSGEVYDICHEKGNATVFGLAKLFAGKKPVETGESPTKSSPSVTGDSARLRRLGWKREVCLRVAVGRIKEFYGYTKNFI